MLRASMSSLAAILLLAAAACERYAPAPPAQPTAVSIASASPDAPAPSVAPATSPVSAPSAPTAHGRQHTAAELDPKLARETAPPTFVARFVTSKGPFAVQVHRDWAPIGADRFYNLVRLGYFDQTRFFRVVSGFMVQWGVNGDPEVNRLWRGENVKDDPVKHSNTRGTITFATSGPDRRTTQVFVNFVDNDRLDAMGFAPFGEVTEGMKVVDALYADYGEGAPHGKGPDQSRIQGEGNEYLNRDFPQLDWVEQATIVK